MAGINPSEQRQPQEGQGLFQVTLPGHSSPTMNEHQSSLERWLKDDPVHGGLFLPISVSTQHNAPQTCSGPFDLGNPSFEVSSSQVTISSVKLITKPKQGNYVEEQIIFT